MIKKVIINTSGSFLNRCVLLVWAESLSINHSASKQKKKNGNYNFSRYKAIVNETPYDPLPSLSSKAVWRHGAVICHVGSGRAGGHGRTLAKAPGQETAAAHKGTKVVLG